MKSQTMCTVTCRRFASAVMTAVMSSVTEAVSHLPFAAGPGLRAGISCPGRRMMSAGERGAGAAS
jgi:hypothetical protein